MVLNFSVIGAMSDIPHDADGVNCGHLLCFCGEVVRVTKYANRSSK